MTQEFYVDILDSSGNVVGDGPLTNLTQLNDTRKLDLIGEAAFSMPGSDLRAAKYLTAGSQFNIYDRVDGYLGRFLYKSKTLTDSNGISTLTINCYNTLRELSMLSVNFNRSYNSIDVATVIADLVAIVPGWSAVVDAGIGNTSIIYNGESVLIAIDALRDRWGQHFRLSGADILEFGAFGAVSGVTLTNLRGQVQHEIGTATEVALVESLELVEESDEIFNRVIPLGAGNGTAQLNISTATLGSYTVQTGGNSDGSYFYYIEDAASVAVYGRRVKILTFPQIAPITNSVAGITAAANALKLSAEAYIARHLVPKIAYNAPVRALRANVKVGDLVRLQYRGIVKNYAYPDIVNNLAYVDVDQEFYVLDITRSRTVTGDRSANMTLATIAERRTADTDVMLEIMNDLKALKVHVPTNITHSINGPYTLRLDSSNPATFQVTFGNEVLNVLYAKLRFKSTPLRSSIQSDTQGGTQLHNHFVTVQSAAPTSQTSIQVPSGGDHYHTDPDYATTPFYPMFAIPGDVILGDALQAGGDGFTGDGYNVKTGSDSTEHTHPMSYGLHQDTQYPTSISLEIDGVDVTAALLGPWDIMGVGVSGKELDITSYLSPSAQANHTIEFSCASGQGEIECNVRLLLTIQAISIVP